MALLLQVLGVFAAGVVVSLFLRGRARPWRPRPRPVAIVAAVAAGLLFCVNVWGDGKAFVDQRRDLAGLSAFEARTAIGTADGQNVGFLEWARRHMRQGDTFAILPADLATRVDKFIPYGWSTFQVSPHRSVDERDADWLVFYGVSPKAVDYDARQFGAPLTYGRGFALARRTDAG